MPVAGIAARVPGIIPVSWDALLTDTKRFGEARLLERVDLVKERIFGEVRPARPEDDDPPGTLYDSDYPLVVQEYVAKLAAIEILGAAIDFWQDVPIAKTIREPSEIVTYEARVKNIRERRAELIAETRAELPEIAPLIDGYIPSDRGRPAISPVDPPLLTPDPQDFPAPFAVGSGR